MASEQLLAKRSSQGAVFLAIGLCLVLLLIRINAPHDLMDYEQQRQGAYVMDAIQNHHWIMQMDEAGMIATKPPMFAWLGAGATYLFGAPEPYAMRSVALLATLGAVLLMQWVASEYFGRRAGIAVVVVYLVSLPVAREIWLARMDAILPLTITGGAVAGWFAWQRGRGWIWFWLAAAIGVLTKGPAGLLCAAPLVAACFEKGQVRKIIRGRGQIPGIVIFVVIVGGWFAAASAVFGKELFHQLFSQELLNLTVRTNKGRFIGSRFYEPIGYLFVRNLPWSLLMGAGIWRVFKHPAEDKTVRRFERFIAAWIIAGIVPFCLMTHQRADLITPLYVPAAILAARELVRWLEGWEGRAFAAAMATIIVVGCAGLYLKFRLDITDATRQTAAMEQFAGTIRRTVGADFPLTHVDEPVGLEIELNTMRPLYYGPTKFTTGVEDVDRLAVYDYDAAARLLEEPAAVFLVTCDPDEIRRRVDGKVVVYDLAEQRMPVITLHILSNRPELKDYDEMGLGVGPLELASRGLKWVHASGTDFVVEGKGMLTVTNHGAVARTICVMRGGERVTKTVGAEEQWIIDN